MRITRTAGDNYPIDAIIQTNGVNVDLTGSTVTFIYSKGETSKVISGDIIDQSASKVRFTPNTDDFIEYGLYKFKIKREMAGIITTHLKGELFIE